MLVSAHSISGGVIGQYFQNPFLAFLLGIIFHFILDAVPHEYEHEGDDLSVGDWCFVLIDLTVAIVIWNFVLKPELFWGSPVLWGAFGGIMPDIFDNNPIRQIRVWFRNSKVGKKIHNLHGEIQKIQVGFWPGVAVQIAIIIFFSWAYLAISS